MRDSVTQRHRSARTSAALFESFRSMSTAVRMSHQLVFHVGDRNHERAADPAYGLLINGSPARLAHFVLAARYSAVSTSRPISQRAFPRPPRRGGWEMSHETTSLNRVVAGPPQLSNFVIDMPRLHYARSRNGGMVGTSGAFSMSSRVILNSSG